MYLPPVLGSVLLLGESYYFKSVHLVNYFLSVACCSYVLQADYLTGPTRRLHYPVVAVSC
ncbi:hypothetical protein [Salmonella phage ST38]|nr:hypothetical protein [Salmonella phage ST38]